MTEITQKRWAKLREQRSPHETIYELADDDYETELIGVSEDGRLHLLLAIDLAPPSLPPDLQSIQVRILEGEQIWIDISSRSHHEELLTLLANKVLYAIRTEGR